MNIFNNTAIKNIVEAIGFKKTNGTHMQVLMADGSSKELSEIYCYGICSTATATQAKTVDMNGFVLYQYCKVTIKFINGNSATAPTLNINNQGAKYIKYNNSSLISGQIKSNHTYDLVYDGAYWQIVGDFDTDSHYTTHIKGTNDNSAVSNPYIKVLDNTTYREQIQLKGAGNVSVASDTNGVITITGSSSGSGTSFPNEYIHANLWYKQLIIQESSYSGDITDFVFSSIRRGFSVFFLDGIGNQDIYLDELNSLTTDALNSDGTALNTIFERYITHSIRFIALRSIRDRTILGGCYFNMDIYGRSQAKKLHSIEIIWAGKTVGKS
ncbi:MAG: hypothetical protein IJ759_07545 [Bacteroidales bacterium]|nr:hypothetical protein [Bacteroidales bacterium]